jgi:phosphatidylglycerophosphatase A
MTAKPSAAAADAAMQARIRAAQIEAARGGWPEGPSCEFMARKKTPWAWTIATFFGAGLGKPGPGTWGSVAATLLWTGVAIFVHPSQPMLLGLTLAGVGLSIALGVPAATIAAREAGREDPGFVVIDEVAGQWITLIALTLPTTAAKHDWQHIVIALLLFRVFDVFKPFPIRHLENLPEGWGIVFDDVAAGLYAGAVLLLLSHWI